MQQSGYIITRVKNIKEREYYIKATTQFGWSRDVLIHQIEAEAYKQIKIKKVHNFPKTLPVHLAKQATNLLFQFLAECYERRSLLITTNLAFSQWDQIFKEKQTTVAAVDGLIHHGYILEFQADSFRLKSSIKKNNDIKKR